MGNNHSSGSGSTSRASDSADEQETGQPIAPPLPRAPPPPAELNGVPVSLMQGATLTVRSEYERIVIPPTPIAVAPCRYVFELTTSTTVVQRPPIELCLVLDVSGSMSGEKLHNLKAAVETLVSFLDDADVIDIVTYSSAPKVLLAGGCKNEMDDALVQVSRLQASGGTNISGALEAAAALLAEHRTARRVQSSDNVALMQQRIFLYTDGQPEMGMTSTEDLASLCRGFFENMDILTSAFGIGTDVNGPLLEAMAESGGGGYEFVTTRRIDELSRKALAGVARVVATRGQLEVTLREEGLRVAVPASAPQNGCTHLISVGDVREGNVHRIPLEFDAPPRLLQDWHRRFVEAGSGSVLVADVMFSCQPVDAPLQQHVMRTTVEVAVECGRDQGRFMHSGPRDSVVAVVFSLLDMSERNSQAVDMLNEGGPEAVRCATQLLEEGIANMRELESSDPQGFVTTAVRRAERTLQRLQARGLADSRRVALELHMQSNTFERQSGAGFAASEDGNHSHVGTPRAPIQSSLPQGLLLRGNSMVYSHGSDSEGSDDEMWVHSPYPQIRHALQDRSGSPLPAPPQLALAPVVLSAALRAAIAATDAGSPPSRPVPSEFFCSITAQVMDDPVMTSDGHTYQRGAIETWFHDGNITSPLTGLSLADLELRPNFALRSMLASWQ